MPKILSLLEKILEIMKAKIYQKNFQRLLMISLISNGISKD